MSLHFHLLFEYLFFQVWKRENLPSLPGTGKACRTPNIWRWINQLTLPVVLDENFPFLDITNLSVRQRKILINGWKQGKKNKEKRERGKKRKNETSRQAWRYVKLNWISIILMLYNHCDELDVQTEDGFNKILFLHWMQWNLVF